MNHQNLMIERLMPAQIREALAKCSLVYMPLGTYEWHGEGLPVGLDALKAHGMCLLAAERTGGLVCPPLYYGTGGAHGAYPWTIMMDTDAEITALLMKSLERWETLGVETLVLFTGHFAGEQVEMIKKVEASWGAGEHSMHVLALSDAMVPEMELAPDHAAIYETSVMGALEPELVQLDRLPSLETTPSPDPEGNTWGPQRHETSHPLYGIFGDDPRHYDSAQAGRVLDQVIDWLCKQVEAVPSK